MSAAGAAGFASSCWLLHRHEQNSSARLTFLEPVGRGLIRRIELERLLEKCLGRAVGPLGERLAAQIRRVGSTSAAHRRQRRERRKKARHLAAATRHLSTDARFLTCSMLPQQKVLAGTENRLRRSTYL